MLNLEYNPIDKTINFVYKKNKIKFNMNYPISIHGSTISCGVEEIDGVNSICFYLDKIFEKYDIKSLKFKKQIFIFYLKSLVKMIEEEEDINERNSFYLLSTNLTDNKHSKIIESSLDEHSECHTKRYLNKNSGNKIKVWILNRGFFN